MSSLIWILPAVPFAAAGWLTYYLMRHGDQMHPMAFGFAVALYLVCAALTTLLAIVAAVVQWAFR